MKDNKPKEVGVKEKPGIPTATLINSKKYKQYSKDFLRALLPKPSYTIEDADKIVQEYFSKGVK
ncbi:MAG: hypothetical protein LBN43_00075 [Oscillospiraceae bacterium]|nr:hypothetical protein [Oscillospiraceae bacterium]